MSCARGGGLMVIERLHESSQKDFHCGMPTARCVNCGHYEDATIPSNRFTACTRERFDCCQNIHESILPTGINRRRRMTRPNGLLRNSGRTRE